MLTAKRLGQLHELVPAAELIGLLVDPNTRESDLEVRDAEAAATSIGRRMFAVNAASPSQFGPAFATLVRVPALARCWSAAVRSSSPNEHGWPCCPRATRIPTSYPLREFALAGGLMSYGPSQTDAYRRRHLRRPHSQGREAGATCRSMQPTKFELVINLKTAKALGITVPSALHRPRRRGDRMRRREFITLLGGAAALAARGARAAAAMPVIGFLTPHRPTDRDLVARIPPGPERSGFVEGQNVAIEYRWAEDQMRSAAGAGGRSGAPAGSS